jgi:hypothetical protein
MDAFSPPGFQSMARYEKSWAMLWATTQPLGGCRKGERKKEGEANDHLPLSRFISPRLAQRRPRHFFYLLCLHHLDISTKHTNRWKQHSTFCRHVFLPLESYVGEGKKKIGPTFALWGKRTMWTIFQLSYSSSFTRFSSHRSLVRLSFCIGRTNQGIQQITPWFI